jgi:D-alanyl-D-alanine carboxypeptidase/D-alanyl-D-alanine-endopeptidase (penicillin-binding protein 4)
MRIIPFALLVLMSVACSPVSKTGLRKKMNSMEARLHDHTGFVLYDLENDRTLFEHQSQQYFTPASNTKIFTFYTALTILGDSIPALRYIEKGDSVIFKGTGDPSFLYKYAFDSRIAFDFLGDTTKQLFFAAENFYTEPFGPGWAWDDYLEAYSSERSSFPIYGNFASITHAGRIVRVVPQPFSFDISVVDSLEKSSVVREIGSNKIFFHPGWNTSKIENWEVPFKTSPIVSTTLLSDTLKRNVSLIENISMDSAKTIYSIPSDSLYKVMMQRSDNFIAEQLLLMCAGVLSDSLKPEIAINYMKKNYLNDLPDNPIWVDGSGLSRYNLFTPRSMVALWKKIYTRVPQKRLFHLLAIGGKSGTLKNAYKNNPPFIFGKTGTLSNNHCVSGFLVSRKGKVFIFSFMNSNHPASSTVVRKEMEVILKLIYERY